VGAVALVDTHRPSFQALRSLVNVAAHGPTLHTGMVTCSGRSGASRYVRVPPGDRSRRFSRSSGVTTNLSRPATLPEDVLGQTRRAPSRPSHPSP
jgi:hypothetical protein